MKVIIAGSRSVQNIKYLEEAIAKLLDLNPNFILRITEVVSGTAVGADQLGEAWALRHNKPVKKIPADWNKHGRSAGPIRNREMARYADMAIVLWDGYSHGAKNMVEEMRRMKKPYFLELIDVDEVVKKTSNNYTGL
jgi:hypothetical protein